MALGCIADAETLCLPGALLAGGAFLLVAALTIDHLDSESHVPSYDGVLCPLPVRADSHDEDSSKPAGPSVGPDTAGTPQGPDDPDKKGPVLTAWQQRLQQAVRDATDYDGNFVRQTGGPDKIVNLDDTLSSPYQLRYNVDIADEFGEITNYSVNYDPINDQFGIVKEGSRN
jgi:hypothetical protein